MAKDEEERAEATDSLESAKIGRLRAELKAVDDQIRRTGKPEKMEGLLADRERILRGLRHFNDDTFLHEYLAKR
jgi:hypothetical protein